MSTYISKFTGDEIDRRLTNMSKFKDYVIPTDIHFRHLSNTTFESDEIIPSLDYSHLVVEFEINGIHTGFDCVVHPYDSAICMTPFCY